MATGDTIAGKVRVVREDTEGNREIVAGPFGQAELDDTNNDFAPEDYVYLNTELTQRRSPPLQAREAQAPDAQFESGEKILIQHQANATVTNDIDHDHDAFNIDILRRDLNRNKIYPDTLTKADQELSSDISESDTEYVTFFEETIPDRTEYRLAGRLAAAAVEN